MVDPRHFAPFDLGAIMERRQRMEHNRMLLDDRRAEQERRRRLSELLPRAVKGDREAIDATAGLDADMFMKLDEHQRKQASAELDDVVAAVRWADTPEKWGQVQRFYGSQGHDVSAYGFEDRENIVLRLGKMGDYLKSAPKAANAPASVEEYQFARSQGFKGSYMDFMDDKRGPLVANNGNGTFTLIPRGMAGNSPQPSSNPPAPPPPGFVIDGEGGQTASAPSGNFPGARY